MGESIVVIVTEAEFERARSVFAAAPDVHCVPAHAAEDRLASTISEHGARAVIVGVQPYRDGLYAVLPRGGVIARFGVGHDGIDKAAATRAGILCTNTPGTLDQSVAELTVLLILASVRHLAALAPQMAGGSWLPRTGSELKGKTLVVIGCGRIGGVVARLAREALALNVVCVGRHDDYAAAVRHADLVSLHLPATAETHHFMNRERLSLLPHRAWLINTARGALIDEAALYDALAAGRLAGAALDVFEREPYAPADPAHDLRRLPNVIMTPHVGSNTAEANARMAERALQNVARARAGDYEGMDLLNPQVLSALRNAGA